ncbi:MAG TPA: hypothetical protein PLC52_09715 [Anaerolineales bacterium]|nr:hypothetical protein [Anaerolineales bacterium]HRQ93127.1 hypothetical protein [Anaerolineales bacterium]
MQFIQRILTLRNLLLLAALVFVGGIMLSIFYETLLPLLRAEQWAALVSNLIGIPIILCATGVLFWGGWRFLQETARLQTKPEWLRMQQLRQTRSSSAERRALQSTILRMMLAAWKPGALWLLSGTLLFILGDVITRLF